MRNWKKKLFTKALAVFLIFSWVGLVSAESITYYHHDVLGTPLAVTDESGDVVWWAHYYPYGSKHDGNSSDTKPQRFTGKEFDEELGLYYFGARYYNPTIARFISVDPSGGTTENTQRWNRYAYALNNPYKYIDPDGEWAETGLDIVSLGWSIHDVAQDPGSVLNWVALGADVVTLALPLAAAGGTAVRTVKGVDKASDVIAAGKSLPKLTGSFAESFEGAIRVKTFKKGQRVHRSSWANEMKDAPGSWFGTRKTVTKAGTESQSNIKKWGNPVKVLRTYEFTRDTTVYYGKVKGGKGYQILIPKSINPGKVLKFKKETILK